MLGLKRGTVRLVKRPYEEWARLFGEEKERLTMVLGSRLLALEHVGSTAIPGAPAKPLIDMNAAVASIDDDQIDDLVAPLKKLGYRYMHSYPDRRFFAKGPENRRTHHLNFVLLHSDEWRNSLLFRDYLKLHQPELAAYAALKEKLARRFSENRPAYTMAKEKFIGRIIKLAMAEKSLNHGR